MFSFKSIITVFGLITFLLIGCTDRSPIVSSNKKGVQPEGSVSLNEADSNTVIFWHIKAIHPEGRTLDVKALDSAGNIYAVKAIQDSEQRQLLDIKALVGGKKVPVKILLSNDVYAPVKAIGENGAIFDIKALPPEGGKLDVKGVRRSGNIIDIKAISNVGGFYGIKAISPEGQLNDVKGVKMSKEDIELIIKGVEVHAHVKALPQVD